MGKSFSSFNSPARRWFRLTLYGLLLGATFLIVLIFSLIWLSSRRPDHLVIVANFLALGTLALALIAGFVALQAYAVATGLPDLKLKVSFAMSYPNEPKFTVTEREYGAIVAREENAAAARIYISNLSGYSARNPVVVVRLNGVAIKPGNIPFDGRWTVIETSSLGITALQWDGGPMRSIHSTIRVLPDLDMTGLRYEIEKPSFTFELLAEGYRRKIDMPIEYCSPGEELGKPKMPEWV